MFRHGKVAISVYTISISKYFPLLFTCLLYVLYGFCQSTKMGNGNGEVFMKRKVLRGTANSPCTSGTTCFIRPINEPDTFALNPGNVREEEREALLVLSGFRCWPDNSVLVKNSCLGSHNCYALWSSPKNATYPFREYSCVFTYTSICIAYSHWELSTVALIASIASIIKCILLFTCPNTYTAQY